MSEVSEYQKSAALMALDITTLYSAAKRKPEMALEFFEMLHDRKEKITNDKEYRDSRFSAACVLISMGDRQAIGDNQKIIREK